MKIETAHFLATHLENCLLVMKSDKSADINLIGKFEELSAKAQSMLSKREKPERKIKLNPKELAEQGLQEIADTQSDEEE